MSGTLPTLVPVTASVTEDGTLVATGSIVAGDTDSSGRTLSLLSVNGIAVSGTTSIVGTYGTLVVQPSGAYTYTLANASPAVRALLNAQTLPELFTTVVGDGQVYTQSATQTVTNLITQSEAFNVSPWVGFAASGAAPVVSANVAAGPTGSAATADQVVLSQASQGLYFKTAVSGAVTFSVWVKLVAGSASLSLGYYGGAANQVSTQSFTATGSWQQVSFSFTADGNASSNVSIQHAGSQSASGTLDLWGAQLNAGSTVAAYVPTTGAVASSTVTTAGAPVVLSSTLTVGVTGSRPVAVADTGAVTTNGQPTAAGNMLANDTDGPGKTLSLATVNGTAVAATGTTTIAGTYGTLVVQAGGAYTYTLAGAQANVQALAPGQAAADVFSYTVSDGSSYTQSAGGTTQNLFLQSEAFDAASWVPFAISGTRPVVTANADPGPNGGASTADRLAFSSAGSGLYFQTPVSGQYTVSVWVRLVSGSGAFSFGYYGGTANAVTSQAETATATWTRVAWTFTADGNASSNVSLMVAASQASGGVLEFWGAQLNPGATAQAYLATTGSAASATGTTTVAATIGSTLTLAVTGGSAGAAPVAAADTARVVEDGATQVATGNVLSNDTVSGGRTLSVVSANGTAVSGSTTLTGAYGSLVIQANGQYAYTLDDNAAAVRALASNQSVTDTFSYAVTDGTTATGTLVQTSQNLVANSQQVAAPQWTVYSQTGLPASTLVSGVGPGPVAGSGTAGQVALYGAGTGVYLATAASGTTTFSIWVRLVSGDPNFSLNYYAGASGAATVQAAVATGAWQRVTLTFTGDGNASSNVAVTHTSLQSGSSVLELWGPQLNGGASALAYVPTSGTAISTTTTTAVPIGATLAVTVAGSTPVAAADSAAVTAGGAATATGNLLANDTNASGLALTVSAVNGVAVAASGSTSIAGTYGTLVVQAGGAYAYTLSTGAAVQALAAGQSVPDAFAYTVSDGRTHTVVTTQVAENLVTQSGATGASPWTRYSPTATLPAVASVSDTGPAGTAVTASTVALTTPGQNIAYAAPLPGDNTFGVWVRLLGGSGAFTFNYYETATGATYAQTATATSAWKLFTFGFFGDGYATSNIQLAVGAGQGGGTFEFYGAQLNPGTTLQAAVTTVGSALATSTQVTAAASIGATLTVAVAGTDAGKAGPALNLQSSTAGVVASLASGTWSNATTVMPLGDSITYGWGPQDAVTQAFASEGYRGPLWSDFLAANSLVDFVGSMSDGPATLLSPLNAGFPGERTDQIAAHLPALLASQHPGDILLLAGTNDLAQGSAAATVANNIAGMLSTIAAASPSTRTYVALILPVVSAFTEAARSAANTAITTAVRNAAAAGGKVTLVDTGNIPLSDISTDGVHPNAAGYALLAQDWMKAITAAQPLAGGTPGGTATAIPSADVNLVGGGGADLLIGDGRANIITAGSGNDVIIGGGGNDTLIGGTGADEFVVGSAAGQVSISGFNPTLGDYLDWNVTGLGSAASLASHTTQSAGSTVVDLGSLVPGLKVTLAGYTGSLDHSIFGPVVG